MKKTITLLVAVLIIACGLPSCGATIIKRQHTHGYYINKNPGLQKTESDRSAHKLTKAHSADRAENLVKESKLSSDKHTASVNLPKEPVTTSAASERPEIASTSQETGVENLQQVRANASGIQEVKPSLYEWTSTTRLAEKRKMAFADDQSSVQSGAGAADTGSLSLFGIIILIILVVWLIAILTGGWGLGGFVHILAVIALILLILWLLRII